AVCFLCHCPSGCPDRALPGALPCGVRTFLPSTRSRSCARSGQAPDRRVEGSPERANDHARVEGRSSGSLRRPIVHAWLTPRAPPVRALPVRLLRDLILLQLLVQVAARRADDFGRLRDVPAVLAQRADEDHALLALLQ